MNIEQLRLLAKAERMMDAGEIPWVWAPGLDGNYERLSVAPEVMEMLELEQSQTINSFLVNGIAKLSLQLLKDRVEQAKQDFEDSQLTDDFDFRKEMDQ